MSSAAPPPEYGYERPREKPYKHASDNPEAHFITVGGLSVGKCPRDLTVEEASSLLAKSIPHGKAQDGHPRQFFAVHRGIPYTTKWTARGRTVHGFPWRFREPPGLPKEVRDRLRERAEAEGHRDAFDDWMKQYGRGPEGRR
jgi:hypothetical protein